MSKPIDLETLNKTIPETTVAYVQTRLDSYDCLFDRMPEMGALMEKAGCVCALPEYCFTNYLEPGYKDADILVEICESVTEAKRKREICISRPCPGFRPPVFSTGDPIEHFQNPTKRYSGISKKTGMRLTAKFVRATLTAYGTGKAKVNGCRKFRFLSEKSNTWAYLNVPPV